ncbi:MAG: M14 family metallopeptidase [Bdellovibrio sp.]
MDLAYYPKNYDDSRNRFLNSIKSVTGDKQLYSCKVPCEADPNLFVDSVYLPPTKTTEKLFILISGTHGLEGYAGSGIQQLFIQEYLNKMDRSNTGILLVHSLNPFGFKYHRRGTESGVNLNRNCSVHPAFFQISNEKSIAYTSKLIPTTVVDSDTASMLQQMTEQNGAIKFADISLDEFVKVIGLGQFHSSKGLEFGGKAPEPQIAALADILKNLMPQYKDVIHLDLHTGLGERARLHLLVDGQVEGLHPDLFAELLKPTQDADVYSFTDINDPGFYKTRGATNNLIAELITSQQRACSLTLEFGTLGHDLKAQLEALNSWLLEHQGSLYGYASKDLEEKIKQMYLERFFPSDVQWKEKVLQASREFFKRVLLRSGAL